MPEFEEEEELLEEEEEGQASEMYEHHRIEADNGQNLLRVDKFLMSRLPNASRTKIQEAADAGNILVSIDLPGSFPHNLPTADSDGAAAPVKTPVPSLHPRGRGSF